MGWYRALIRNHTFANICYLLVVVGGVVSYNLMPRARDPDVSFNFAVVTTVLPGASAEDVAQEVTSPLEDATKNVQDIDYVTSSSRESVSTISIRFKDISADRLQKRLTDLRREITTKAALELPQEVLPPQVQEIGTSSSIPTALVVIYGQAGGEHLRDAAYTMQRQLQDLKGVANVRPSGLEKSELQILFDPAALDSHGVSPTTIADVLKGLFNNVVVGRMNSQAGDYLVRLEGKTPDPEIIAQTPIPTARGLVRLSDLAQVQRDQAEAQERVRFGGRDAVMFAITKQEGSNTLSLVEGLQGYLSAQNKNLEQYGLTSLIIDDQTPATRSAIAIMEDNAYVGFWLVCGVCLLFLGYRMAIITSLAVPFSLAGTFIVLNLMGQSLNLLTLMGAVIALGMLVDDAVVMVETLQHQMRKGLNKLDAAVETMREVGLPVVTSSLTTVASFFPLLFLAGVFGKFMQPVPVVVIVSLMISLVQALWLLPAHAGFMPSEEDYQTAGFRRRDYYLNKLKRYYLKGVLFTFRRASLSIIAMLALLVVSVGLLLSGVIKRDFFAADSVRLFYINVDMPLGTTLEDTLQTTEDIAVVVKDSLSAKELRSVTADAGRKITQLEVLYGYNYGQVFVSLQEQNEANTPLSTTQIIAKLREPISRISTRGVISYRELKAGPPVASPINIKVKSDDYVALREAVDLLKNEIAHIDGVRDVAEDGSPGLPEMTLSVDKDKLVNLGLNPVYVGRVVRLQGEGEKLGSIRDRGREVNLVVRSQKSATELMQRNIIAPNGSIIPMSSILNEKLSVSSGYIRHYRYARAITIDATIDNKRTDTLQANQQIREIWSKYASRYPQVELDFQGELADFLESINSLWLLFLVGMGGIYFILVFQFASYSQPFLIMLTLPMAFTGVVLGLVVSGYPLSLFTLFGTVALSGIAVNAAIVLIDAANQRLASGMSVLWAIMSASRRRLVPILVTSVTTVVGLFGLALGIGGKSLMWGPMASSIVFGLVISTILTLYVMPLAYFVLMSRVKKAHSPRWQQALSGWLSRRA